MADELNSNTKGGVNAAPKAVEPTFAPADEPREALAPAASGEAPAAAPQGFGAMLRAAREAQGISLGDMAVRSRLSVAQVRALEEEDVAALPEPVYVRAFIRGCAHSLGLDPQALSEDYMNRYGRRGGAAEHGQIPLTDPSREEVINSTPRHRGLKVAPSSPQASGRFIPISLRASIRAARRRRLSRALLKGMRRMRRPMLRLRPPSRMERPQRMQQTLRLRARLLRQLPRRMPRRQTPLRRSRRLRLKRLRLSLRRSLRPVPLRRLRLPRRLPLAFPSGSCALR